MFYIFYVLFTTVFHTSEKSVSTTYFYINSKMNFHIKLSANLSFNVYLRGYRKAKKNAVFVYQNEFMEQRIIAQGEKKIK